MSNSRLSYQPLSIPTTSASFTTSHHAEKQTQTKKTTKTWNSGLPMRVLGSVVSMSAIAVKLYCRLGRSDAPSVHCREAPERTHHHHQCPLWDRHKHSNMLLLHSSYRSSGYSCMYMYMYVFYIATPTSSTSVSSIRFIS